MAKSEYQQFKERLRSPFSIRTLTNFWKRLQTYHWRTSEEIRQNDIDDRMEQFYLRHQ